MSRRRVGHLVLAIAGLLVALYPFTLGADPTVTCRGVELRPGESCAKADGSSAQTYEARAADARNAAPVIVGVGVLVAVFGAGLLIADVRRDRDRVDAPAS
jgi:hypothetical protein